MKHPNCAPHLAWIALLAIASGGCGFFKAAGELTLAKQEGIPRVAQKIDWPDIDKLTGSNLDAQIAATGADGEPLNIGIPSSLKKGTLAHVQGLLSLAGDCRRSIAGDIETPTATGADGSKTNPIKDIQIHVTNCSGDERCDYACGDFQGMELEAQVEFQLLNQKQAAELKQQLAAANPENAADGIVQIRLQFFKLDLYQKAEDGKTNEITSDYIDSFDLMLNDAWAEMENKDGKETVVLQGGDFKGIDPKRGKRFEVDPASEFIASIKRRVINGEETRFRIILRIRVQKPDLYLMRFDGAGVELDVQPEVVVSVLDVVGL